MKKLILIATSLFATSVFADLLNPTPKDVQCFVSAPKQLGGPVVESEWRELTATPNTLNGNNFSDEVKRGAKKYSVRVSTQEEMATSRTLMDYSISVKGRVIMSVEMLFQHTLLVYADQGRVALKCVAPEIPE